MFELHLRRAAVTQAAPAVLPSPSMCGPPAAGSVGSLPLVVNTLYSVMLYTI